jgi:hypothetical protein
MNKYLTIRQSNVISEPTYGIRFEFKIKDGSVNCIGYEYGDNESHPTIDGWYLCVGVNAFYQWVNNEENMT